jgi:uncharacterized membrane protein
MSLMAIGLAFGMVALDQRWEGAIDQHLSLAYQGGAEGARAVLSTIASSMITVAGVTFSITIVALTLAAQQYGPRLLGNFLRDVGNQVVLGTFIATFLYCLLVLRTIRGGDGDAFVPQLSVSIGVLLAMASLAILIYFIHHVSGSIQASRIVAAVGVDLAATVDRLFPEQVGEGHRGPMATAAAVPPSARALCARHSGYIQAIDGDALLETAVRQDVVIHLERAPGDFVIAGATLARVSPPDRVNDAMEDRLRNAVMLGIGRTTIQDIGFAIDQLVEVALRALSPGVNDPFTAITCIDHLGAGLSQLAQRCIPSPLRGRDGQLRVVTPRMDFRAVLARAVDPIREAGRHDAAVLVRLLDILREVGSLTHDHEHRDAIRREGWTIVRASGRGIDGEEERERVAAAHASMLAAVTDAAITRAR